MKFKMISAKDLRGYIDREDILLFDLREREDYERGHIGKAIWEDWERLEDRIDGYLSGQKEQIHWIILYCDRGNTSLLIARDLARMGYPVMSLNGGYAGWERLNA
ncbi:MAG: rhodanese-like domain-containing protein [Lachnospiraceae bacterium]|nr:rhodanese-like domain-containing protein [Lachnospiraceae bacterium]